jgi:putative transposase
MVSIVPNVLDRTFEAPAPNRKWIADFKYVWTAEGWLYVAAVVDLFSRRVVGWVDERRDDSPARHRRADDPDLAEGQNPTLLHHSDRGRQYQFQRLMADHGVVCSMSRSANSGAPNAQNVSDARRSQGRRVRIHRTLLQTAGTRIGYRSPMEFERQAGLA